METQALADLAGGEDSVIDLGGGVVLAPQNRQTLADSGRTVLLTADLEVIQQRLAADPETSRLRPPLTDLDWKSELRQLLLERQPVYEACADCTIDTSELSIDEVVERIARWWR